MADTKVATPRDVYDEILDKSLAALQACQAEHKEHTLTSCLECEKLLDCAVRDKYVKAVYESMSHGATGDFSF